MASTTRQRDRIREAMSQLLQGPWVLTEAKIIEHFGEVSLGCLGLLETLVEYSSLQDSFESAYLLLQAVHFARRSGLSARSGVASDPEWLAIDVRDAMSRSDLPHKPKNKRKFSTHSKPQGPDKQYCQTTEILPPRKNVRLRTPNEDSAGALDHGQQQDTPLSKSPSRPLLRRQSLVPRRQLRVIIDSHLHRQQDHPSSRHSRDQNLPEDDVVDNGIPLICSGGGIESIDDGKNLDLDLNGRQQPLTANDASGIERPRRFIPQLPSPPQTNHFDHNEELSKLHKDHDLVELISLPGSKTSKVASTNVSKMTQTDELPVSPSVRKSSFATSKRATAREADHRIDYSATIWELALSKNPFNRWNRELYLARSYEKSLRNVVATLDAQHWDQTQHLAQLSNQKAMRNSAVLNTRARISDLRSKMQYWGTDIHSYRAGNLGTKDEEIFKEMIEVSETVKAIQDVDVEEHERLAKEADGVNGLVKASLVLHRVFHARHADAVGRLKAMKHEHRALKELMVSSLEKFVS